MGGLDRCFRGAARTGAAALIVLGTACSGSSGASSPAPRVAPASVPQTSVTTAAAHATPAGSVRHTLGSDWPVGASAVPANVGINVEGVVDYSISQPFVDAMKQSRPWGSPNAPYDQAVAQAGEVDANGWPTVDAGVLVLCCVGADESASDPGSESLLTGTYALSFKGSATVSIPIFSGSVDGYSYDPQTNVSTASVTFGSPGDAAGETLYLSFTGTRRTPSSPLGSGVTDVRLLRPQFAPNGQRWWTYPGQRFTDPFLASLRGYSTLRFMDWAATNGSVVVNWADRTPVTYATAQRRVRTPNGFQPTGAPWEDAIELCNRENADMWINVPAQATDEYVRSLARLIRHELHANLHVYVEYSNEVWNGSFAAFAYNLAIAESEAQTNPAYKANCSPSDRYRWGQCRVAERLMQISRDFAGVDGRAAIGTTIRPVFATQEDQTYDLGGALGFIAATYGPPSSFFYAVAQAPYWNGDQTIDGESEQQELQAAETNLEATVPSSTAAFTAYAVAYGLHNFTYEGGPGMYGTPSLAAKIAANEDPQIGAQVTEALGDFFTSGGDMFVYYNDASAYGQYGMWGTTQDVFDLATPKVAAIAALRGTSQVRTVGAAVPGSIAGTASSFEVSPGGYSQPGSFYFRNGETLAYLVDAPSAGTYALTLTVGSYVTTPSQATISVDGVVAGSIATPTTGGNPANEATSAALSVALPQGLSVIDVAETNGEFALYSIELH
jgi:hypothetical protein